MVRVTISAVTDIEKPKQRTPHSTIRINSSLSSVRHFRWRCRCKTSLSAIAILSPRRGSGGMCGLVDPADQVLDLLGVRAEVVGKLVEIGIGDLLEAGLVDVGDDLHSHLLELGCRRV